MSSIKPLKHILPGKRYLLAVSGGIDSMVMAEMFRAMSLSFAVVHCNFSLRGSASDEDQQFVQAWCEKSNIPFYTQSFDTKAYAASNRYSIQEAARKLRYAYFDTLLHTEAFDFIATAHHQDDAIETMLFHFVRGCGLHGMRGIPAVNGHIVRPLIQWSRAEIIAYANSHQINFREDSSNTSTVYTRNMIRLEVLPFLESKFPGVRSQLGKNLQRFEEASMLYDASVERIRKRLTSQRGKDVYIPIRKLSKQKPLDTITYELIKPYGFNFEQAQELLKLTDSQAGHLLQGRTHRIVRHRDFFIITPVQTEAAEIIIIDETMKQVSCADFNFSFDVVDDNARLNHSGQLVEFVDAAALQYPLILRKWKQGDYLHPLGMVKKKKVSRLLIDAKYSLPEKERVWVLESNSRIVWVIGLRLDHRFRITPKTTQKVRLTCTPK
jgi:tRNA(Ile)-lysidine synthase